MKSLFAAIFLFLSGSIYAVAQPRDLTGRLLRIKSSADSLIKSYPAEKLYLQLDKPNYAVGDTLWFKAYLFNAPTLALSAKSGIMYLDIANDSNKVVKQMRFRVSDGLAWGNISLNDLPSGNYILRAYTNWMRNFGDECFYYKRFALVGEQWNGINIATAEHLPVPKRQEIKPGKPQLKNPGAILSVADNADSVTVSVNSNGTPPGTSCFLTGKARNIICYAAVVSFNGDSIVKRSIAKDLFPSGVTHLMLTDTKGEALNERLIFIDHHDNLRIELQTDKQVYALRDSSAVHIKVTDARGNPVKGNFSMAVTDDNQVRIDSLQDNIVSHLLLTSEIKGYTAKPGYYLRHSKAFDNLLLTSSWLNYDWPKNVKQPRYPVETEFEVSGTVLNGLNAAVKSTKVTLFSKTPYILKDTITDKDGRFTFRNFPQVDTPVFFLKAVNRRGNSFNVGIKVDEVKPAVWTGQAWLISADTIIDTGLSVAAKNNRIRKEQGYLTPNGHLLKEVRIVAKKIVKGSQNLNGPGNADFVMDETDILKEGKKSLLDMLVERVKGFRELTWGGLVYHRIYDRVVLFLVDGQMMTPWEGDDVSYFLKTHSAEDIKGIEANISVEFNMKYNTLFFPGTLDDYAYIEITTRSGNGPHLRSAPGTYLYKPLAISNTLQFYSPRYYISDTGKHLPDTRSTIYWAPNINTDENGEAILSFYTADKPGTYTVIFEGTDLNGNLGHIKKQIVVNKPIADKQR